MACCDNSVHYSPAHAYNPARTLRINLMFIRAGLVGRFVLFLYLSRFFVFLLEFLTLNTTPLLDCNYALRCLSSLNILAILILEYDLQIMSVGFRIG